jgi:hypothetical protein
MGANGINAVAPDGVGSFHNQISGITLQALNKTAITLGVTTQPTARGYCVAEFIFGTGTTTAPGSPGRDEVVRHWIKRPQGHACDGSEGQQIHELPTAHTGHITGWDLSHG